MRKIKLFLSLLMVMLLSVGNVWATQQSYTIELKPSGTNTNSALTASNFVTSCVTSGGDYISSCASTAKVYTNGGFVKLGSSSAVGNFTLNLSEAGQVKATSIVVSAKQYSSSEKTLKITCSADATGVSFTDLGSSFTGKTLSLDGETTITSITVTTTTKRGYVESVTVYYDDDQGGGSDPVAVTGVTLNKSELSLEVDESETLTATIAPNNATNKNISWESSNTAVATVTNGEVTAVAEGSATITVTTEDGSFTDECAVTITAAAPAVEFVKFSGDIEEGDYVIYYGGKVVKNIVASNRLSYDEVTPVNNKIKNPSDAIIWHIAPAETEGYWTLYNENVSKYAVCTNSNNQANLNATATANALVTVSEVSEGSYEILSKARQDASSNNYYFRNNGTYGFAFYASGTGGALTLYKNASATPVVAKPTISGEENFVGSTSVSISHADADHIYYTTNGDAPTTSSAKYTAPFSLTNTATVKAIAVKGSDVSAVAEATFTKATVMTVAQARAAIDAGGDLSNKFVAGIISQIDSYNSTYNSITYWISDDGTTTDQLQVYSGLAGVVKSAFASKDDLAVGDDVTVKGTLKKYNSTYEFDYNNTIEAYKPIARLAWSAESFDAALEGENTFPSLTNTNGVTVSYNSSDPTKASFADASVYEITLNAAGSTTITATFAGNETYKANSVSYTLNVASSLVTLTYNVDGGETIDPVNVSALPNPLPTTTKAGKNFGGWFTDPEKEVAAVPGAAISENTTLYAKWLDPYTVAEAKTVIDANPDGIANQYVAGIISQIDSYQSSYHSITYWISADGTTTDQLQVYSGLIGNAATALEKEQFTAKTDLELGDVVVVTGTLKFHNNTTYEFDKNNSIYTFSRKASAGLAYEVTAIQKTVGDDLFTNPLTNPNSVTVTYSSSDEDVAVVDETTGEVLVGEEGTATITAAFAGNAQYKAAEVSYTVTVSAAAPVLTDYYEKVTETAGITDGTYLIVYEAGNVAFNGGLETLDAESNTIAVAITNDNKIGVTEATAAATFFIDVTAGSIQAANGQYIGVSSNSNGLKTSDDASTYTNAFAIDNDGNAVISAVFSGSTMTMRYNSASNQARFRYYKDNGQQAIQLYKLANETVKANPGLAWSGDVEITLGETFTAPTLENPNSVEGITFASDNTDLATVTNAGVIELVENATGTAHITASFAGNDDYKAASVSCTIIVNASAPVPAETKNVVILAEYNSKFYAMTNSLASGALASVEVEKDGDKIVVFAEADKAAIQWTMTDNTTTATFQDSEDKYLAHTGTGTSLALQDAAEDWTWDSENGYYYAVANRTFFYNNSGVFKNYSTSNLPADKTDYSGAPEIIEIAAEDIILSQKAEPQLAYDPAEVTLTVGETFTPAVLSYAEGFDGLAAVTYASNNENVATVDESGVVSLEENATGTATITATFAGNNNYLAGSASYTITINEAGDDLSGIWVLASSVAAGDKFIVVGSYNNKTMAMGKQNSNNRAAVASSVDEWNVLTPGAGTKVFTLVDAGEGKFAIQASNGKYLSAAGTGTNNYLREAADFEADNAKWTISIENGVANVVASSNNRNVMRYNSTNNSELFSCYQSGAQRDIQIFKIGTPDYGSYQRTVTAGNYGTICLPKAGTIEGATLFEIASYENNMIYVDEVLGGEMAAGTPYIFYATSAQLNVTYTSGEEAAAGNANGLYGSYTEELLTANDGNYILYNNQYWFVNSNAYVGANRAYIKIGMINYVAPAPGRRRVAMAVNGEQVATGIDALNAAVAPVKKMIDGQLFILRGEKMYDATGRLVK